MNEKEKSQLIAQAENVEAIEDFFHEWYTVEELYEAEAKSAICVLHLIKKKLICDDDATAMLDMLNQHMMMVEHMKPFNRETDGEA